ncbi:unnamed protein product [Schistosoma curassoni]|uniref:Uncharacterized protein n=1 Tax=Schistosoma curassoni TaxID=6186 RepID=A0A183JKL4_9TREM|nr:unnamed protein product [Schistosoma curassoni]
MNHISCNPNNSNHLHVLPYESELFSWYVLDCLLSRSIIPFSLRLLHAELPFNLNRTNEALDRLYYLLAIIGRVRLFAIG